MTTETLRSPQESFRPYLELRTHHNIEFMNTDQLFTWLAVDALNFEHTYLRAKHGLDQISPEGKILFLVANDVTQAKDFKGNFIHTRHIEKPKENAPKLGEIPEALASISDWFESYTDTKVHNAPEPSKIHPVNEVLDVVYNLANLSTLDPSNRERYVTFIRQIAKDSGIPMEQLLRVTALKYNFRLGQGRSIKDHATEDMMLLQYFAEKNKSSTPIPLPSNQQLHQTFTTLSEIDSYLSRHVDQLRQLSNWGISHR